MRYCSGAEAVKNRTKNWKKRKKEWISKQHSYSAAFQMFFCEAIKYVLDNLFFKFGSRQLVYQLDQTQTLL